MTPQHPAAPEGEGDASGCPDCGFAPGGDGCGYSSTCECPTCGTAVYCDGAC